MANLYITYFVPEAANTLETYFQSNEKEKLSRFVHQVEGVDELFKSFSNTSRGTPVFLNGGYGCIEIDPAFLKDLPQLMKTGKDLIKQEIALGIGKDIKTSAIACKYSSNKHAGQKAVLFQPEMFEDIKSITKAEEDVPPQQEQPVEDNSDEIKQTIVNSLKLVNSQKQYIEQLRQTDPKTYEAIKSVVSAMISMAQQLMTQPGGADESETEEVPAQKSEVILNKAGLKLPASPGKRRMSGKGPKRKIFAGSVKNGKRKVIDPLTGKSKWVSANPK